MNPDANGMKPRKNLKKSSECFTPGWKSDAGLPQGWKAGSDYEKVSSIRQNLIQSPSKVPQGWKTKFTSEKVTQDYNPLKHLKNSIINSNRKQGVNKHERFQPSRASVITQNP